MLFEWHCMLSPRTGPAVWKPPTPPRRRGLVPETRGGVGRSADSRSPTGSPPCQTFSAQPRWGADRRSGKGSPLGKLVCGLALVGGWLAGSPLLAQETQPGLQVTYRSGTTEVKESVPHVDLRWSPGRGDPRWERGPVAASYRGTLIVPTPGRYRFPIWGQGRAELRLGGRVVIRAELAEPGWEAGNEVELDGSDLPLELDYTGLGRAGELRLFWSGPGFLTEPLSGRALEHEAGETGREEAQGAFFRGRDWWEAARCTACHGQATRAAVEPAPALTRAASTLRPAWFIDWLSPTTGSNPLPQEGRLGHFPSLQLSRQEAADLLAALHQHERPATDDPPRQPEPPRDASATLLNAVDRERAETLVLTTGCLACHEWDAVGRQGAWTGPRLADVAGKRTAAGFRTWLTDPAQLNARHRMPIVPLTESEQTLIADWLSQLPVPHNAPAGTDSLPSGSDRESAKDLPTGDATRGLALLQSHRCGACHELPGTGPDPAADSSPRLGEITRGNWNSPSSCVANERPAGTRQPRYRLSAGEQRDLEVYFGHSRVELAEERGAVLWRRRGCANCHERHGEPGLRPVLSQLLERKPEWRGQTEGLLAPDLSAVGDKLRDEWLQQAVAGEQPRRLPWLRVRMPRFAHSDSDRGALANWFVQSDRIPAAPPGGEPVPLVDLLATDPGANWVSAGLLVGGGRGFSCVGCHKVGPHEPRGVGLATRGSDLYRMDQRLRPEFFTRWLRGPLRVVPNHEMPAFVRPLAGVLEGRLDRQFAALWKVLSDPTRPPAFDTSTIEQAPTPDPSGPPLVIRDLFQIGGPGAMQSVPRAAALGFPGGLSLLFDWDRLALRGWWSGPFARQRASGKSWFWEPAGEAVQVRTATRPDLELLGEAETPLPLREDRERWGRLLGWRTTPQAVAWRYRLSYQHSGGWGTAEVVEEVAPLTVGELAADQLGWQRTVIVRDESGHLRGLRLAAPVEGPAETVLGRGPEFQLRQRQTLGRGAVATATEAGPQVAPPRSPVHAGRSGTVPGATVSPAGPPVADWPVVETLPGYRGVRLPFPAGLMPTAVTLRPDGSLAICSLKGQIHVARDADGDGVPEQLQLFEEGLAAAVGILAEGDDLLVAHKREVIRLRDTDGDGRADLREVVAAGWGYTDDYHDWTTGLVRDSRGRLYVGLGSDYSKGGRSAAQGYLRGKVLRIEREGTLTPLGHQFRFPIGLAINAADEVFVSDNQGVQNPFNEINHLVEGGRYGVPSLFEEPTTEPSRPPAIQVPHPWTRSVNGLFFLNADRDGAFVGDGIGCEYDSRFLVRFQVEEVAGRWQGAVFPFSQPPGELLTGEARRPGGARGFLGTLCGTQGPRGEIYIGAIHDSGWTGGANVGEVVRLIPDGPPPLGLRSLRVRPGGFQLVFTRPIEGPGLGDPAHYAISGLTREWKGGYATPDSGQHRPTVERVEVSPDRLTVTLRCTGLRRGFVYEVRVGDLAEEPLWPAVGYYTLHAFPGDRPEEGVPAAGPPAEGK